MPSYEDVILLSVRVQRDGFPELARRLTRFANSQIGMQILSSPTSGIGCGKTALYSALLIEGLGYVMACEHLMQLEMLSFADVEQAEQILAIFGEGSEEFRGRTDGTQPP